MFGAKHDIKWHLICNTNITSYTILSIDLNVKPAAVGCTVLVYFMII